MRKTWLHQTRIGLALYDVAGQGFLRESVCTTKYGLGVYAHSKLDINVGYTLTQV